MKIFLAAAVAALTLSGAAAAQPYGGYTDRYDRYGSYGRYDDRYDRYDRRYYDRWDWYQRNRPDAGRRGDYDRRDYDGRYSNRRYYDRYFDRYGYDRRPHYDGRYGYGGSYYGGRWRPGDRFPYYRSRAYMLPDYRAYGLPPPRRGHRYYRSHEGDIVMAAVASGIIAAVVGRLDERGYDRRDGYWY